MPPAMIVDWAVEIKPPGTIVQRRPETNEGRTRRPAFAGRRRGRGDAPVPLAPYRGEIPSFWRVCASTRPVWGRFCAFW